MEQQITVLLNRHDVQKSFEDNRIFLTTDKMMIEIVLEDNELDGYVYINDNGEYVRTEDIFFEDGLKLI